MILSAGTHQGMLAVPQWPAKVQSGITMAVTGHLTMDPELWCMLEVLPIKRLCKRIKATAG